MQRKSEFWYCEKKNVIIYSRSSEQYPHHVIQKWPTAPKSGRRVCTIACSARQQASCFCDWSLLSMPTARSPCLLLALLSTRVCCSRWHSALLPPDLYQASGEQRRLAWAHSPDKQRGGALRLLGGRSGWVGEEGRGAITGPPSQPSRGRAAPPTAGSGGCSARAARAASSNLQDESPGCARHYSTHPCHGRVPILLSRRKAHGHSV